MNQKQLFGALDTHTTKTHTTANLSLAAALTESTGGGTEFSFDPIDLWSVSTSNILFYTSTNSNAVYPYRPANFGSTISSNTYNEGVGKIVFNGPIGYIGTEAFHGIANLKTLEIASSVNTIGQQAFDGCIGLISVTIPNSVNTLKSFAFYNCSALPAVVIPNSVTSIEKSAFNTCSGLTSVTLPNALKTISWGAFCFCSSLSSITIPASVTTIEGTAFKDCTSLTAITVLNPTPPTMNASTTLQNVPADCAIYVPAASVDAYKAATNWSARAAYIQAIPS